MINSILLCLDGEPHTCKAEEQALHLASQLNARLCALYVVDSYLKKFTNEIYAVNRNECRAHLDQALEREGHAAIAAFEQRAQANGLSVESRVLAGDPAETIADLARSESFDLVIIGGKVLDGAWKRFESRNLPERLNRLIARPLLVVR